MLRRSLTALLGATILIAGNTLWASSAFAGDGWGHVDCDENPTAPGCDVSVGAPGTPADGGGSGGDSAGSGSTGGQEPTCTWERVEPQASPPVGAGGGAWYERMCQIGTGMAVSPPVWHETTDPRAVAQEAVSRLRLPAPAIRTNPDSASLLVHVPVWLWVDDSTWGDRRATASVPGMSVTAIATPTRVTWSTGDGGSRQCGKGTPWVAGADPASASPDCGHTYTSPSRGSAGGTYTVTATITWRVTWSGGGTSGTEPDLTSTASVPVQVIEASAVNTNS
ncbi:hypothetical protein EDC02_2238 [Micromonospora sp. Llam0]|nr:hypothetical protein EDC02_2238 [Micromonospora sp. Llam0]